MKEKGEIILKKNTKTKIPSFYIGLIPSVILICLCSCVIFIGMVLLSPLNFTKFFIFSCFDQPLLLFLNLAPIMLLSFFLYGLTARAPLSIAVTAAVFLTAGAINHYKILFRSDPFIFADLTLYREAVNILKTFDPSLFTAMICGIVVVVILLVLLVVFFRKTRLKWPIRIILPLFCLLCSFLLYVNVYTDQETYDRFPISGYVYNQVETYSSRGWTYSFIYNIHNQFQKKPENYSEETFREKEETAAQPNQFGNVTKPNIIMIMSEAFSDYSENDNFSFSGYRDPLQNYKKIANEAVVSGHVSVNIIGGGTAITEYEVLTGISMNAFSFSANPYTLIRKDFPNLTSDLKAIGYDTIAVHPGYGWFYNRQNVYRYFGFDHFYDIENGFENEDDMKGSYISEAATFDKIEEITEPYINGKTDNPAFIFCVTIQNHGGYAMKYDNVNENFQTSVNLTDNQKNLVTNYFHGVIDADVELDGLINSLRNSDEPFVVVYWGDHYPSLEDTYNSTGYGFSFTGNSYDWENGFFTPFFIWQNAAAEKTASLGETAEQLGLNKSDNVFDASFLGGTLLQLMKVDSISPFTTYANTLRNEIPVSRVYDTAVESGGVGETIAESSAEAEETYRKWCYYRMFDR